MLDENRNRVYVIITLEAERIDILGYPMLEHETRAVNNLLHATRIFGNEEEDTRRAGCLSRIRVLALQVR